VTVRVACQYEEEKAQGVLAENDLIRIKGYPDPHLRSRFVQKWNKSSSSVFSCLINYNTLITISLTAKT